jgi:1-acyl-sn-glycerol-3-phosphate acyltransferase
VGEANSVGWDADAMAQFIAITRPIAKVWFRPEVRGLDTFPSDGALVVSNHSGGVLTTDTLIFSMAFYDRFGFDRPVHTLGHSALFVGPIGDLLRKTLVNRLNRVRQHHAGGNSRPRTCTPARLCVLNQTSVPD